MKISVMSDDNERLLELGDGRMFRVIRRSDGIVLRIETGDYPEDFTPAELRDVATAAETIWL